MNIMKLEATSKFIWNVMKKGLYFKTLKSKMVYLGIFICVLFILDAQYWKQRLRWRYDVKINFKQKYYVNFEWLPLVNHSTYNENYTTCLYTKLNTTIHHAYSLNML